MRVLIVDDNATNIMVVQEMLKRAGYEKISTASSAKEMFDVLDGTFDPSSYSPPKIDLILLDLMMPVMDGIEACRIIQTDARYRDIPVIMVTAIGDSRKLAEALDAGAIDFVTKPINKTELLARIRTALRLKRELDWHKEHDRKMQEELTLARKVQESVLPDDMEGDVIRAKAFFRASEQLAGDLYMWHRIDEGRWCFAVIDAMGHGLSSSLVSMFVASVLKEAMRTLWSPERVFRELNRRLLSLEFDHELITYYCTGIYATIDLERGRLEYANAGHPPGLLYKRGKTNPIRLGTTSAPLGMFDSMQPQSDVIEIESGDKLYFYTDGVLGPFPGDDLAQIDRLAEFLLQSSEDEDSVDQLIQCQPLDGRSDDRCLIKIEVVRERLS
ncbi:SpoIIE family protein phosphatase [Cohnella faecalis]|uniref:Fused response regulator/phosphatase n=1 Tax=Cohnella faecalis TaxID=2315694 RepID=A0A398CJY1_9BACL|nr:fused response regulator/phosphatase [Cohnella faecalis]RIE02610.1 fused response regulator/phosphatase [Cohnella faecalis]